MKSPKELKEYLVKKISEWLADKTHPVGDDVRSAVVNATQQVKYRPWIGWLVAVILAVTCYFI